MGCCLIFRKITPRIYQGDEPEARSVCCETSKWLELGINAVICSAVNIRIPYANGLACLLLPIMDNSRVDPACFGGLNRSITFAAALAYSEGQSLDKTFQMTGEPVFKEMRDSLKNWIELRKFSR